MIGKLKGTIDQSSDDSILVDVNGVGYLVFCSTSTIAALPEGSAAEVVIETHVREDHFHLYGFLNTYERDWFRLLSSVQGVGAKMALAILGTLDSDTLTRSIGAQDKTTLTTVKGVGPKVAERIVTELKSKVAKMGAIQMPQHSRNTAVKAPSVPKGDSRLEDAVSALVNLGYNRTDAFTAIATVMQSNDNASLDAIIRDGLKELVR